MNFYIYKIIFDRSSFELNEDYERLSENEIQLCGKGNCCPIRK